MTAQELLNSHSVFCAVESSIFAGVAVAFVGRAIGEALLAQFVAEIEGAGDDSKSDAGPHQRKKWAADAEIHVGSALFNGIRSEPLHNFESGSRVHWASMRRMLQFGSRLSKYFARRGYQRVEKNYLLSAAGLQPCSLNRLRTAETFLPNRYEHARNSVSRKPVAGSREPGSTLRRESHSLAHRLRT